MNFNISLEALEDEALIITGNDPEHAESWETDEIFAGLTKRASTQSSRWTPRGKITFEDDILGVQPVERVRIRYGRRYSFRTVRTNSKGEFTGKRRRTRARYKIEWRADDFVLQKHRKINKGYSKSAWNKHLTGKDALCAVVWVAAREYFYGDIDGLSRPRKSVSRLGIKVRDRSNKNRQAYHLTYLVGQSIGIYLKSYNNNDRYLTTAEAYSTTIHELAHCAHFKNFKKSNRNLTFTEWVADIRTIVKESFARGIEWHFCVKRYGQNRLPFHYEKDYTGIVEDLIDDDISYARGNRDNQLRALRDITERVSGFTINQIEDAVFKSHTWNEFRDNLKADYPSGSGGRRYTEREIDQLFANWGSL